MGGLLEELRIIDLLLLERMDLAAILRLRLEFAQFAEGFVHRIFVLARVFFNASESGVGLLSE